MKIETYRFGHIEIDGAVFKKDILILPPNVRSPWQRQSGHRLCMDDLTEVVQYAPRTLVIGTGKFGILKVPDQTRREIEAAQITVEVLRTKQACRRFNTLAEEGENVAAAFHLNC